jgi:hypothetical protein
MKVRPVGSEFHSDGHDEANSRFSQFCERAKNLAYALCPSSRKQGGMKTQLQMLLTSALDGL